MATFSLIQKLELRKSVFGQVHGNLCIHDLYLEGSEYPEYVLHISTYSRTLKHQNMLGNSSQLVLLNKEQNITPNLRGVHNKGKGYAAYAYVFLQKYPQEYFRYPTSQKHYIRRKLLGN